MHYMKRYRPRYTRPIGSFWTGLDDAFTDAFSVFENTSRTLEQTANGVKVSEADGKITAVLEVPGFAKDDIDVHWEDGGYISIEAARGEETSRVTKNHRFYFHENIDSDEIEVKCENGLLTIAGKLIPEDSTPSRKKLTIL